MAERPVASEQGSKTKTPEAPSHRGRKVGPRKYASTKTYRAFGDVDSELEWPVQEGLAATGEVFEAYVQHRICKAIDAACSARLSSVAGLARALNVDEKTLQRKFRGGSRATLAEMFTWSGAMGMLPELAEIFQEIAAGDFPPTPPEHGNKHVMKPVKLEKTKRPNSSERRD